MAFQGWPVEALAFYRGLEADNTKSYWEEHRAVYETAVAGPVDALIGELSEELSEEFGPGKMFRPYRDVRFSRDKSPYKTQAGAVFERGGYVQLSADGLATGAGDYRFDSEQLTRFRAAVDAIEPGTVLQRIVDDIRDRGDEVVLFEELKRVPRGFAVDHPRAELLRAKGLAAWHRWGSPPWVHTAEAAQHIRAFLRGTRALCDWLDENVGSKSATGRR